MSRIIPKMKEFLEAKMRHEILKSADEIIISDGIETFTLEKIALMLGVARSTIYNYFENKDSLLDSLVEHNFICYFTELDKILSLPKDAISKLTLLSAYVINDFNLHKQLHQGMMKRKHSPFKNLDFRYYHSKSLEKIALIIEQGVKSGELRAIEPMLGAAMFNGILRELSFDLALGIITISQDKMIEQMMDCLIIGLQHSKERV